VITYKELRLNSIERGDPILVLLNGRPTKAYRGESIHSILVAAGIKSVRKSRSGDEERGPFCGMGVCYECLVTVDGKPNVRACMTEARDGMKVEFHGP
jgi:sarcosine oxidase subunit alpha